MYYLRLFKDISDDYVIFMDCIVFMGVVVMMVVCVFLDYDVFEDKIFLLLLFMVEMGVYLVVYVFLCVRIIIMVVDKWVNDFFCIILGIGNFGDCYFGIDVVFDGSDEEEVVYMG